MHMNAASEPEAAWNVFVKLLTLLFHDRHIHNSNKMVYSLIQFAVSPWILWMSGGHLEFFFLDMPVQGQGGLPLY